MGRVEAEFRMKAAARGEWLRRIGWPQLLRRATFVLCLLDAIAAESQLSALAKTGSGADRVTASPVLVALLLVASFGAAALLRWQDVFDGVAGA